MVGERGGEGGGEEDGGLLEGAGDEGQVEAEGLLGLPGLVVEGLCGAALWAEVVVVADTRVFDAGALGAAVAVGLAVAAADDLVVEGHKERYFDAYNGETKPLHDQIVGGGKCKRDADCGPESSCEAKACACAGDWLGPHCRAYRGFDDVVWEHEQTLGFHAPFVPASLGRAAVVLSTSLAATLAYHVLKRREGRQ